MYLFLKKKKIFSRLWGCTSWKQFYRCGDAIFGNPVVILDEEHFLSNNAIGWVMGCSGGVYNLQGTRAFWVGEKKYSHWGKGSFRKSVERKMKWCWKQANLFQNFCTVILMDFWGEHKLGPPLLKSHWPYPSEGLSSRYAVPASIIWSIYPKKSIIDIANNYFSGK